MGADESLFKRLDSEEATVTLTLQYRMNKTITKLANDVTYKGSLKCGNDTVASATLNIPSPLVYNHKVKTLNMFDNYCFRLFRLPSRWLQLKNG